MVAGVEHNVVLDAEQRLAQAPVHLLRIASRKIDPTAGADEEGVARDESLVDEKALGAGGMPRSVKQLDLQVSDLDHVARVAPD